jgi:hypothetical protein
MDIAGKTNGKKKGTEKFHCRAENDSPLTEREPYRRDGNNRYKYNIKDMKIKYYDI